MKADDKQLPFSRDYHFIEKKLDDGLSELWLAQPGDVGATSGPFNDWISHKKKYFEKTKHYRTIITAGGNMGVYVRAYAKIFETVYAFEPSPKNFYCMTYNTPETNVHHLQMALGARSGWCTLNTSSKNNSGTHEVAKTGQGTIPMVTIDQFGFEEVDIIQLDVEGYESQIIKGAMETIKKWWPIIIAERGFDKEVGRELELLGYNGMAKSHADVIFVPKYKQNNT